MRAPAEQTRAWIRSQTPEQREKATPSMLKTMITDPAKIDTAVAWSLSSDTPNTVAQVMYEIFLTDLRTEIKKNDKHLYWYLGAWVSGSISVAQREKVHWPHIKSSMPKLRIAKYGLTDTGKHFIMWDDPDGYFKTIDAFLSNKTTASQTPR